MARKTWDSKSWKYVDWYSWKWSSLNPTGSSGTSGGGTTTYSHHVEYDANNRPVSVTTTNNDTGTTTKKYTSNYQLVDPSLLQDAQTMSASELAAKWWGTADQINTTLSNYEKSYGTYWNWSSYPSSSSTRSVSSTKAATPTTTTTGRTPDRNRYAYNTKSWYYEVVKNKNWMTYQEDPDYYGTLYDKDKFTPDAQYEWKTDNDWLNDALNGADAYRNDATTWNADFVGNMNSNMNSFGAAVNNKLKTAFWIDNMAQLKEMYPEQYTSLVQSLNAVAGTWNALDPSQRQLLDWQLQAIIWTAVGAWSDTSKLNVLSESILSKFKDPDQVKQFVGDVTRLQTQWMNTAQIAEQMGVSEDMVQQWILAANGLDNKLWEHFELTPEAAKDITEDYDTKMERLEEEKRIALERANRNIEWLKEDFNKNYERQKQANEINLHNADFISGQYGFWFSKRGLEWLNYVEDQAKQIIDDMVTNYDRTKIEMAEWVTDIIRNWERNNEDLEKACEDALTAAKNNYTSNMLAIQQQYGTVWMQAQQQMANNVQNFITQAENIYDNALQRQQQNLTNLITNFSNLNALQYSNLTLRNAKIQQFQSEALTMNRSQLQQLANQLWMSPDEYGDLLSYQVQAVQNQLNGYAPWAWVAFQDEINTLLQQWANGQEVLQRVMNQPAFKQLQSSNTEWTRLNDNTLYDKSTWQIRTVWGNGTNTISSTASSAIAATTDSNGNYKRVDLQETPDVDTWISNVYGSTVKLSPTVWAMFKDAYNKLAAQWIELKVWDSYRSYETQKKSYESGKAWVASPDKSYHVKGQAFDVVQDGSMYTDEVVQALLDAGFTRPVSSEPRHWSYGEGKDAFGGTPSTSGSNMSDYDINTATMRIGRMAYWANISNSESERVEKVLRDGAAMWKSQTDILYDVLWMTITNNKDKAEPLINIMIENADDNWLKWYDTVGFANLINAWKIDLAVNKVEKAVADKQGIWQDFIENEASALAMYEKWNKAIDLINDNLNSLWIVAGNWNKQKSKFLKNQNFQQIESALTSLVADWRHQMAGSAVTQTELQMIDALIPSVKDNPYNAIEKIKALQNDVLTRYNSQRWSLDLPSVDLETLKDKKKRADLYYTWSTQWRGLQWSVDLSNYWRS